jgi:hypothetical protein
VGLRELVVDSLDLERIALFGTVRAARSRFLTRPNFFFLSAVNWVLNGQLVTTNVWAWDIDDRVGSLSSTNTYRYSRSILFGLNAFWAIGQSGRYIDPFLYSVQQRTNELEFTLTYEI